MRAGGVVVRPDDLAHIVDAEGTGAARGQGIVEGGVDAVAEEEAVLLKSAVFEKEPHDLARVVDAGCNRAQGARQGIVDGDVETVAVEVKEAVEWAGGEIKRVG